MSDNVDLSATVAAKSDQLNADDLIGGPMTFIVRKVRAGEAEQPIWIDVDGWPQPWKPCKTQRRILIECWGKNGADYAGRSLTLFRNPEVKFGGIKVGGIEISHMSHIEKAHEIALAVSRGKKKIYVIQPIRIGTSKQQTSSHQHADHPLKPAFEAMKERWKQARAARGETVTADDLRSFVSESTGGRVGMADALIVSKYTQADIDACSGAVGTTEEQPHT